jgi:hypothetical protein
MIDIADVLASLSPAEREAKLNGPALTPPSGIVSNFESPPNENYMCFVVLTISLIIATLLLLVRAYARIFCVGRVYIEDGKDSHPRKSTLTNELQA